MASHRIPEEFMDNDKISKLAAEIARTFMSNKANFATEDFINTYLNMYETARKIIYERIYNRQAEQNNQNYDFNEISSNNRPRSL